MTTRERQRLERQEAWHQARIAAAETPLARLRATCEYLIAAAKHDDDQDVDDQDVEAVLGLVRARREPQMALPEGQAA